MEVLNTSWTLLFTVRKGSSERLVPLCIVESVDPFVELDWKDPVDSTYDG